MTPSPEAFRWFESDPDPIDDDLDKATLIARLGMVSNALASQLQAANNISVLAHSSAVRTRDLMSSLVLTASLTHEALQVIGPGFALLREMATTGGARPRVFDEMGKLRAGKHAASEFLKRARNSVGFHWDAPAIRTAVHAFAMNKRIVWLESDASRAPVHAFSLAVLTLALFGAETLTSNEDLALDRALDALDRAMRVVLEFCTACVFGYMKEYGVERRERPSDLKSR